MAYVLGFWYADGYMRHIKSYRVSFYSNDLSHLFLIRRATTSNAKIFQKTRNGLKEDSYYLVLHSKKLFNSLLSLGGKRNKSRTLSFPAVQEKYLADFIRGYFDGDGSVHLIKYRASKNGRYYREIRSNFTCGSKSFLEKLREILHFEIGLATRAIGQYGPHQFKLGYGQKDTFRLLSFMYYPNHSISLNRKSRYLKIFDRPH